VSTPLRKAEDGRREKWLVLTPVRKAEDGRRETARLAGSDAASGASKYSHGDLVGGGVADDGMVGVGKLLSRSATALPRSDRIDSPATSSSSRGEGGGAGESKSSWDMSTFRANFSWVGDGISSTGTAVRKRFRERRGLQASLFPN
tara:strand:+ start:114 stop:551 length:438 start_codon:yes stop_codon:yes gene_type:complete